MSDVLFRELVDLVVKETVIEEVNDLDALYSRYGLESRDGSYRLHDVASHVRARIPRLLNRRRGWSFGQLLELQRQLIYRHILDGAALRPALDILEIIVEELRFAKASYLRPEPRIVPLNRRDPWLSAIRAAWEHLHLSPGRPGPAKDQELDKRRTHWREFTVAEQGKVLRYFGFHVKAVRGRLIVPREDLGKIWGTIADDINRLGAVRVGAFVFANITYDEKQDRYHFPRTVSTGPPRAHADVPIGYILNLCIQQLTEIPPPPLPEGESKLRLNRLFSLATALFAIYDVQPYNVFQEMFHTARTLIDFLRSRAIYDSAVSINQMRPADVTFFLAGVFDWVDEQEMVTTVGWSMAAALSVTAAVLKLAAGKRGPMVVNVEEIARECPRVPYAQFELLIETFTHRTKVNQMFRLPNDVTALDFWRKPLMPWGEGMLLLIDARWCGPAFYEAIATVLRDKWGGKVDDRIGKAAERLVLRALHDHGVPAFSGDYKMGAIPGQCDAVVETPRMVIFGELKKKSLTRLAKAGRDVDLIVDLAASLLSAYLQAAGHEILIRERDHLDLQCANGEQIIHPRGRDVETIVLSLLDFGSFNDRDLIFQFLKSFLQATFHPRDAKHHAVFAAIQAQQQELVRQLTKLIRFEPNYRDQPFFNTWFISIPQLLVLLDGVTSAEQLDNVLRSMKYIVTGSGDFGFELARARERQAFRQAASLAG